MGGGGPASSWRVLVVDSYDSFTCNLAQLVRASAPGCSLHIIKNDSISVQQLYELLPAFDAVIIGPGPGSPEKPADVGIVPAVWNLPDNLVLPVFGVCLGLQTLCLAYGGTLHRLRLAQHGRRSQITHDGSDIFTKIPQDALAVRYHSLHVSLGPVLRALAVTDDEVDGQVLMAARHPTRPFWGVQYHPESICSSKGAAQVIDNFFQLAYEWRTSQRRRKRRRSTLPPWFQRIAQDYPVRSPRCCDITQTMDEVCVQTLVLNAQSLSVPQICERLGATTPGDFVLLDSAANPGRFSILGLLLPDTPRIQHFINDPFITVVQNGRETQHPLTLGTTSWGWVSAFMRSRPSSRGGDPALPFWGGLIGYFSYEAGAEALGVRPSLDAHRAPDTNLTYIERSIVFDSHSSSIYIQSIRGDDLTWLEETRDRLTSGIPLPAEPRAVSGSLQLQDKGIYKHRICQAQDYLASGDSYELCLTAQARLHLRVQDPPGDIQPTHQRSWTLFRRLRSRNPAPYAAYLRFGSTTFVGSSPERFLSWDRNGRCELRPIKGTVRKAADGSITRAYAEQILRTDKEVAENLMIVDLIRHDLHARAIPDTVSVPQLMQVEEYERVYQLVSVVEGRIDPADAFGLLQSSLPPGSMTGAPKKRSVELLQDLEQAPRGVYSGVLGYWCTGGGGDWSVVIRSCISTGATADDGADIWNIGAGGAITILSDPEAEWDEMEVKLNSVLSALG